MNISITGMTIDDVDTIVALYMKHLDGGDYIEEELRNQMARPDFIGLKAVNEKNKIVGFVMGCDLIEFTIPHHDYEKEIYNILYNKKYWVLQAFLVLPGSRHVGLGSDMILMLKEELIFKGYTNVFIEIWIKPDGTCPSKHCYDMLGKKVWSKVDLKFYEEGYKYGVVCSLCGTRCKCGAMLEVIELDDSFTKKD